MEHYVNKKSAIGAICDINTTPLVDVMLVLLIIFMITAPIQQHRSKATLPAPTDGEILPPPALWTLEIFPAGAGAFLLLEGEPITLNSLPGKIAVMNTLRKKSELNLRTDPNTSYDAVAKVLATLQRSGAENVRFDELRPR